jgi:pyruvate dehydrogenase E2 component (dihydrolipoamide acetyltransferase)
MAERVFVMPDPGEGLEEGTIVEWLVAPGDTVELNQPLVEVETAKAAVEIGSPFAGTIVILHGEVGSDVPVGSPLVTFDVEGAEEGSIPESRPELERADVRTYSPSAERHAGTGPVTATPPVRRLAKDLGVDIETVRGTGPGGRVTEPDVRRTATGGTVDEHRREIAEVLTRQAAIPQVTTFRTVDCSALQAFRRELELSPLPIVVAALCATLEEHPLLNARWAGDAIERRDTVNVAIAVDTDRGLTVPVVQDAARRGIVDLSGEITRLAEAARAGTLALEDAVASATIAVSNTGSYGSEAGTPILSPGTSATMAIGVIAPRALVIDGEVVARPAATLSLTFDHRVLDGAAAGRFLTDLIALVQSPERLRDLPR